MRIKTISITLIILFSGIFSFSLYSSNFELKARIESVRSGNIITAIFREKPLVGNYSVIDAERVVGSFRLLDILERKPNGWRAVGRAYIVNEKYSYLIRAGADIALSLRKKAIPESFKRKTFYKDRLEYKKEIILLTDKRKMVLIPAGKFYFGSDAGDRDEYPLSVRDTGAFYIDRYEVSNRDFRKFADSTRNNYPEYWENTIIDLEGNFKSDYLADIPARVTYYEAVEYSRWAGKRLPTEKEWEKAARGLLNSENPKRIYPWGNSFDPERVNSFELWMNAQTGKLLKEKFGLKTASLLPVYVLESEGKSPFGVVNMSGNVPEWTSSWYLPHEGNNIIDGSFGKQFRVIKGGAWYESHRSLRISNREKGGIPSLRSDRTAGLRCVKDPGLSDRDFEYTKREK